MSAPNAPSQPTLIADIGGTNARFALVWPDRPELEILPAVKTAAYPSPEAAAADLLRQCPAQPKAAVLAIAAPIAGERIQMTNGPWLIDPRRLIDGLRLGEVILINDFEAQALALPRLGPESLLAIGEGARTPDAPKLVLGPGTGLGAAALVQAGGWRPVGGEGGHVERAPLNDRERAIWPHIERDGERVDSEQIVSGPGLLRLYRAICAADGISPVHPEPSGVVEEGLAAPGPAREALDLFAINLGRFAGDLALVFMALGGVYVAGGIALRLAPFLAKSGFRAAFEEKPPYRQLLKGFYGGGDPSARGAHRARRPGSDAKCNTPCRFPAGSGAQRGMLHERGRNPGAVVDRELIDKITILQIKREKITDVAKVANVINELERLLAVCEEHKLLAAPGPGVVRLGEVNRLLVDVEDDIRDHEHKSDFGDGFVKLARSVYVLNDERARLKRTINVNAGSRYVEEKSYR